MVPKPQNITGGVVEEISKAQTQGNKIKPSDGEEKEIVRDEIFERFNTPWGFPEQHYWNNMWLTIAHIFGLYAFYLSFGGYVTWTTIFFEAFYGYFGGLGITVGCHRYWTHKTFKANMPLQILMMIMQTAAVQYPIHKWSLDHRIHHKYTDTDSDPHNSKRGFWYSHVGWLYLPKHPELKKKLTTFDMPDLESDPVVRFQSKYYWTLVFIFHTALPVAFLMYFYDLPLLWAVCINYRRYLFSLHFTWFVNSIAHKWGDKPYDKNITAVESAIVALAAAGEGWHNYHHTFPWDYKASEFGWKINLSTFFIDCFAAIGWAWDMKTVSQKMLKERLRRTGDGSHIDANAIEDDAGNDFDFHTPADVTELMKTMDHPLWGWDDERMTDEFRNVTKILNPDKKI